MQFIYLVMSAAGLILAQLAFATTPANAAGSLATRCQALPELIWGSDNTGYAVSQKTYELETGKCYKLEIVASGKKEYAIRGADFFRNIWVRKIEVGGVEIKAHSLYELEFENEGEAEIFFVPIQKGKYELAAQGLVEKGTAVTFDVK